MIPVSRLEIEANPLVLGGVRRQLTCPLPIPATCVAS